MLVIRSVMPREHEGSAASRAITALAMRLAPTTAAEGDVNECTLELMFVLPDPDDGPVFEGMRLSHYAENARILGVDAAVPPRMVNSERAAAYVAAVAADAVDAAHEFFEEQNLVFDARRHQALLLSITARELEQPLQSCELPESTWVDAAVMDANPGPE